MARHFEAVEVCSWAVDGVESRTITEGKEYTISSRIFVGNLSYETTEGEIEAMFSEIGQVVEVFLPADRISGRPRGFAFVEFADETAAAEAISRFNEKELNGRSLRVTEAEERQRPPRFPEGGPPPGHRRNERSRPKGSRRGLRAKKRSL